MTTSTDLWGRKADFTAKGTQPKGYAATPGTGPAGETCKTCAHLCRKKMAKTYLKCSLMRHVWTGGNGSDVKAGSPACSQWQEKEAA